MRRDRSIDPAWFEKLYRDQGDPWRFETSPYEHAKYDDTLAALPQERFGDVLEVGCANGVLTQRLAPRCDRLLAVDVSDTALAAAAKRLEGQPHVRLERRRLPIEAPAGSFDLILLSEVVYYWDAADVARLAEWLASAVASGGYLLLVHWIGDTDYPQSADAAVDGLAAHLGDAITALRAERRECYRLDLWRRR